MPQIEIPEVPLITETGEVEEEPEIRPTQATVLRFVAQTVEGPLVVRISANAVPELAAKLTHISQGKGWQ